MEMEEKKNELTEAALPVQELPADIPDEVRQKLVRDLNEEATEDLKQDIREAEKEEARDEEVKADPEMLTKSRLLKMLVKKQYVKLREVTEEEPPADLHGLHLLMAEDNELNREIAVTLLEEQGAAITTAKNGREAVELFQNAPQGTFDAVLMDVMMPEMNGLEATRAIRAFEHCPPESGIPIIAMTANVFADDVKACLEAGMNAHVGKPLDMQVLAAEICRQMRRHTALLESADFTKLGN